MTSGVGRRIDILVVDDNPGDVRLVQEALRDGSSRQLHVVGDGEAGLAFLRAAKVQAPSREPDLVLLDLNLPRKDGREVLKEIKEDPQLRATPVVVFTGSSAQADVQRCYELRCNCYVKKPLALEEFVVTVRSIADFWTSIVRLPQRHD